MHHAREHRTVRPAQARGQRDHRPRGVSTSIGSRIRRRSSTSRSRPIASRLDTSTIGCSAWRWRPRAARSSTARPERRERLRVAGLPRSDRRGARGGDQRRPRVTRGRRSGVRRRHSRGRKRATRAREAGRLDHGGRLAGGGGRVPTLADACTSAQGNRSFAPAEAPTRARRSAPARIRIGVVILRAGRSGDVSLARGAHKSELYNIFYKYPPTGGFTRIRTYFEYYMCQRFLSDDGWIAPDVPLPAFVCPQAMVRAHRSFSRIPEFSGHHSAAITDVRALHGRLRLRGRLLQLAELQCVFDDVKIDADGGVAPRCAASRRPRGVCTRAVRRQRLPPKQTGAGDDGEHALHTQHADSAISCASSRLAPVRIRWVACCEMAPHETLRADECSALTPRTGVTFAASLARTTRAKRSGKIVGGVTAPPRRSECTPRD